MERLRDKLNANSTPDPMELGRAEFIKSSRAAFPEYSATEKLDPPYLRIEMAVRAFRENERGLNSPFVSSKRNRAIGCLGIVLKARIIFKFTVEPIIILRIYYHSFYVRIPRLFLFLESQRTRVSLLSSLGIGTLFSF